MQKKSGKPVPLFDFSKIVKAGVVSIINLSEKGNTVVRP